jgi:hypothetical protein
MAICGSYHAEDFGQRPDLTTQARPTDSWLFKTPFGEFLNCVTLTFMHSLSLVGYSLTWN